MQGDWEKVSLLVNDHSKWVWKSPVVQEWVEGLAICLLNSAAEAIGCCKEVVEATDKVHQWAGVGTACLPGEKSMSLQDYMTLRIGVTRRC